MTGLRLAEMRIEDEDNFPLLALNPSLINIVTVGHKGLYLDFAYFWLLQTLTNDDDKAVHQPEDVYRRIQLVIRHQPEVESIYTLSCFVMALDYNKPLLCEEIANIGMKARPDSWLIPAVVGYMFAFILKDPAKASYYYQKTESKPKRPEYVAKLSRRLMKGLTDKEDGTDALRTIVEGTDDEDYREFLIKFLGERK